MSEFHQSQGLPLTHAELLRIHDEPGLGKVDVVELDWSENEQTPGLGRRTLFR